MDLKNRNLLTEKEKIYFGYFGNRYIVLQKDETNEIKVIIKMCELQCG